MDQAAQAIQDLADALAERNTLERHSSVVKTEVLRTLKTFRGGPGVPKHEFNQWILRLESLFEDKSIAPERRIDQLISALEPPASDIATAAKKTNAEITYDQLKTILTNSFGIVDETPYWLQK